MYLSRPFATLAFGLAACLAAMAPAGAATYTPVELPSLNADIRQYSDGGTYGALFPTFTGSVTRVFNDVPFLMTVDGSGNTAYFNPQDNGALTLAPNVAGATVVYTLINSAFGAMEVTNATLVFTGSAGASHSVDLVQGTNLRDHFNGFYNNTINLVDAVPAFDTGMFQRARLDMQIFVLPAAFHDQTLTGIRFEGVPVESFVQGQPFLVAATVAAVPEPESVALMSAGLLVLLAAVRRRKVC